MIALYVIVSILVITQIITIIKLRKKLKKQAEVNKILEKNQQNLSNTLTNISTSLSRQQQNIEKQYDNIKRMESLIIQKLNPLLDKNQITDELRTKLHNSEMTVNQLRSTILQMTTAIKRMQKQEKEEKKHEVKPSPKRQRKQNVQKES